MQAPVGVLVHTRQVSVAPSRFVHLLSPVLVIWAEFAACTLATGYAGSRLSRYADVIGEKTGLGGTWIGLVLLASVTSLPELVTGITAVAWADAPNIAVGDVLGSQVFNLAILVVLDYLHRGSSLYTKAKQSHVLSAGFGVLLMALVGFDMLLASQTSAYSYAHIGYSTPLIIALYLVAMRTLYRYEVRQIAEFMTESAERYRDITLRQAATRYAIAALVVVAAGIWLPFVGTQIARLYAWHDSFVGTLFIAAATSLPEMVVTLAAMRLGAIDMAIANLLGSNLFNVAIIAIDDLAYTRGALLAAVAPAQALSVFSALMMTGAVVVGLIYRAEGRVLRRLGWVSLLLVVLYLANTWVLFRHGG